MKTMRVLCAAAGLSVVMAGGAMAQEVDEILSDLRENNLSSEDIRGSEEIGEVEFVSLEDFAGDELQALQDILMNTEDGFAEVRTAIAANEVFEGALDGRDVTLRRVTAVTHDDDLTTFYTDMPLR